MLSDKHKIAVLEALTWNKGLTGHELYRIAAKADSERGITEPSVLAFARKYALSAEPNKKRKIVVCGLGNSTLLAELRQKLENSRSQKPRILSFAQATARDD